MKMTDWKLLSEDKKVVEAVAEAWASIDGKSRMFNDCKKHERIEREFGHYEGYMAEAKELLTRVSLQISNRKSKDETK